MAKRCLAVVSLLVLGSCAARTTVPTPQAAAAPTASPHENLNAVLWMQTAVEYEASALQAYRLAALQLERALSDPSWTAALEQKADASKLPPAVVVDVDETVLDNSYFQARQVRDNTPFTSDAWDAWTREARATAVPGALEFVQEADRRGVAVFYITNRTSKHEEATRRNLEALRFPLRAGVDTVLTRGERPEWQASNKSPRRAHVASSHRVLLSIGDDLGDFTDASGTPADRGQRTAAQRDWWGRRWIMLPNPTYGSWERAIVGERKDPIAAKRAALKFQP